MQPSKAKFKRFKLEPKYIHQRSEGLTHRRNKGTALQVNGSLPEWTNGTASKTDRSKGHTGSNPVTSAI